MAGFSASMTQSSASELDRGLLARVAAGEEAALGVLYDRYAATLYAVAYRVSGERADAEEVVLESFAQAWRDAGRFRQERGSVVAWLVMLCRSRALDLVRARRRQARLRASAGAEPAMGQPSAADLEVERSERSRVVASALEALPAPQREALELAYFEGLSQSEIAERLGEPIGTVKTRVRTAMQKLRDALRPYYHEPSR